MGVRFTVLASGSAGNATLIEADGFGVLLDAGLGPRQLAQRMAQAGVSWQAVHALLLTHTHSDHWNDRTFTALHKRGVLLYCHASHHPILERYSSAFPGLLSAGLVRTYEANTELELSPALHCRPLALRHDGGATFGFRFQGRTDLFGQTPTLAYAADLGCWDADLADALSNVDLLALEFNHDVAMERSSSRQPALIARVLGDEGHLSNMQAVALLGEVLRRSPPRRLRYLVQLHLSRDCNRPALAAGAAREALLELDPAVEIITAAQDIPSPTLSLGYAAAGKRRTRRVAARPPKRRVVEPWLPGLDEG